MSILTPELNLVMGQDDDDTADYLTVDLASSLSILDGLFNSATGHNHNGSHQGGALVFLDVTIGEDLTVVGSSELQGAVHAHSTLTVDGTTHLVAAVTCDAALSVAGNLSAATALISSLTVSGASILATLTVSGASSFTGLLSAQRIISGGYDAGAPYSVAATNGMAQGFWYQRNNAGVRCWDNADFTFDVASSANTMVRRDGTGAIVDPKISANVDIGSGAFTFPNPSGNAGLWRYIKARGGDRVLGTPGGQIIFEKTAYASGTLTLRDGDSFSCWTNGTDWYVL